MKKIKFPSALTILLIIAAITAALTWIIPSGKYDVLSYNKEAKAFIKTSSGVATNLPGTQKTLDSLQIKIPLQKFTGGDIWKPINIPDTFKFTTASPQGFAAFIKSPVKGIIQGADIIFMILTIGGLIAIINHTGAFDAGISWLAIKLKGREYLLIIFVTLLVAIGGTTFGLAEETMAFYPILIPVFLAARYDALVGLACIFVGSSIGSMFSTVNPFSAIIASNAAGINWTTGIEGRFIMLIIGTFICIGYIMRYANRVKNDPSRSLIFSQKEEIEKLFHVNTNATVALTGRLRLILFIFTMSFVVMIYGVSRLEWWFEEMTATFLAGTILIGLIARINESVFVETFVKGAGSLLGVALTIGVARGVSIIMDEGMVSDTMLYYASNATEGINKGVFANFLMVIYAGLSFFIPSSSGMAVLTMPIMAPLADTAGVGREIVVDAYQCGMGLFAFISPTGLILASLAVVKIGYDKWMKFILPLVLLLTLFTVIGLTLSVYL